MRKFPAILFYSLALLGLCVFYGCKKEKKDTVPPVIEMELPVDGNAYSYNDEIHVQAKVTDESNIETIKVDVVDEGNRLYLQSITYRDEGTSKTISTNLYHDDIYLPSGTYYVRITANDGENETVKFRAIHLNEVPRELKNIFVVRESGIALTTMDSLTTNGLMPGITINGSYTSGGSDSRYGFGFMTDGYYQALRSFPIPSFASAPSVSALSGNNFSSNAYDESTHVFYSGCLDGRIFSIDRNLNLLSLISEASNWRILEMTATENYLYVFRINTGNNQKDLTVYFKESGAFYHSIPVDFLAVGIIALEDENHILIAGNQGSSSHFEIYNNSTNAMNNVFNFYETSNANDLWPAADGNFYIHHDAGLTYYTNNLENFQVGLSIYPSQLRYEPLSHTAYVITNSGLSILNEAANQELASYPSLFLKDVLFIYNK